MSLLLLNHNSSQWHLPNVAGFPAWKEPYVDDHPQCFKNLRLQISFSLCPFPLPFPPQITAAALSCPAGGGAHTVPSTHVASSIFTSVLLRGHFSFPLHHVNQIFFFPWELTSFLFVCWSQPAAFFTMGWSQSNLAKEMRFHPKSQSDVPSRPALMVTQKSISL